METQTVFKYAELSDAAKQRAVQWYRDATASDWEPETDDYVASSAMLGFELGVETYTSMRGVTRTRPAINYSLGYCQSVYACFDAMWDARSLDLAKIQTERPGDATLFEIGAELMALVLKWPDAHCRFTGRKHSPQIDWAYADRNEPLGTAESDANDEAFDTEIREIIKRAYQWLYDALLADYEYATSEENAIEAIESMDYDFNEDGERA